MIDTLIITPTLVKSDSLARNAITPEALHSPAHEAAYDTSTVFYDVAFTGPDRVELIAPPLLNFASHVRIGVNQYLLSDVLDGLFAESTTRQSGMTKVLTAEDEQLGISGWTSPKVHSCIIGTDQLEADGTLRITIDNGDESTTLHVAPRPQVLSEFAGKNILVTWNKDNDLQWIHDWITFHAALHDIDGVLIYDNASTTYSPQQLLETMQAAAGAGRALPAAQGRPTSAFLCAVVPWLSPIGPAMPPWTAYFGPAGILEHARSTVLAAAQQVLHFNIDEYALASDKPLTSALYNENGELSKSFAQVPGHCVVHAVDAKHLAEAPNAQGGSAGDGDAPRCWNFRFSDLSLKAHPRTIFNPQRLGQHPAAYFTEVGLLGLGTDIDESYRFAHVLPLTTGWGNRASRSKPVERTLAHWVDPLWIHRIQEVFPDAGKNSDLAQLWKDTFYQVRFQEHDRDFAFGYVQQGLRDIHWDRVFPWQNTALMFETRTVTIDNATVRFRLHVDPTTYPSFTVLLMGSTKLANDILWEAVANIGYPLPEERPYGKDIQAFATSYDPEDLRPALDQILNFVWAVHDEAHAIASGTSTVREVASKSSTDGDAGRVSGVWKILDIAKITLPSDGELFRMPEAAQDSLTPRFMSLFDGYTLFTDFFCEDGQLIAVGPPRLNLKEDIRKFAIKADGQLLQFPMKDWEELDRASRLFVPVDVYPEELHITAEQHSWTVRPGRGYRHVFANRTVALTMNRNNDLQAIQDWTTNLVKNHGATAVIVYDNGSTLYSKETLLAKLQEVEGLEVGFVVNWPQKFGPIMHGWKSDFGQYIAWEHARWRFTHDAAFVLQGDVDEIAMTSDCRPLTAYIEESKSGLIRYQVCDAPPVPREGIDWERTQRLCTDYLHLDTVRGPFSTKIAYAPQRIPKKAQIKNHEISYLQAPYTKEVLARHIRGTHLGWRDQHATFDYEEREFDAATDKPDPFAEQWYRRTFPERFASNPGSTAESANLSNPGNSTDTQNGTI